MTDMNKTTSDDLDNLLAEASEDPPAMSGDLMARVLRDAHDLQPRARVRRVSLLDRISDALGGWQGGMALASAVMIGLWMGYANASLINPISVEETVFDPSDARFDEFILEG